MAQDTTCVFSTIKNVSGGRKKFGFLPPHGRELEADEEFTVFGNILDAVVPYDRATSRRWTTAFENALKRADIIIINTPSPILHDIANGNIRLLRLDNNVVVADDVCWEFPVSA